MYAGGAAVAIRKPRGGARRAPAAGPGRAVSGPASGRRAAARPRAADGGAVPAGQGEHLLEVPHLTRRVVVRAGGVRPGEVAADVLLAGHLPPGRHQGPLADLHELARVEFQVLAADD